MEPNHPLWRAPSLTLAPSGSGRGYAVEITDGAGAPLATCDAAGTIRDHSGDVLLVAPLRWRDRGDRPTDAGVEFADAEGQALGTGRVIKYGVGPRSRKATMAIADPRGGTAARLEPRDKKGEQLTVAANGDELASVSVAQVKSGFLRKSRVYTVDLAGEIPAELRPLVVAASIRYDALLNAVVSAAARD